MPGVLSRSSLEHAVAGSAGTIIATLLLFPLERIKTLLQIELGQNPGSVLVRLLQEEGPRGLYRGCTPMVQTVGTSQFLYFYLFQGFKEKFAELAGRAPGVVGPYETLLASAIAGALNMAVTEPLWRSCVVAQARSRSFDCLSALSSSPNRVVLQTCDLQPMPWRRLNGFLGWIARQALEGPGVFGTVCRMWATEGPGALWRGLGSSLWLVSNPVIQFFAYDLLKTLRLGNQNVTTLQAFLLGAIAKALATVATFPLQVAQSKLRAFKDRRNPGGGQARPELDGMVACLRHIARENGFWGLYSGLSAKLLQTVTQAAFMFAIYEKIHWAIRRANTRALRHGARNLSSRVVPVRG